MKGIKSVAAMRSGKRKKTGGKKEKKEAEEDEKHYKTLQKKCAERKKNADFKISVAQFFITVDS